MALDAFDASYRLSVWRGLPLTIREVPASGLREALPDYELRPFGEPPNNNPRMRCIVRMPTNADPFERPVAAVSDQYDLLQHRVLATWLTNNLNEAGIKEAQAKIVMTEHGERVRITVPLVSRGYDFAGDLIEPDRYQPEIEVTNSVDRSTAFTVLIRWRRLVCLNGMFTMEQDRMRSVHRFDLSQTDTVRKFMAERLVDTPDVVSELKVWRKKKVDPKKVQDWVDGWLRKDSGWSVENCARMWHILATGYDGTVRKPREGFERHPLSAYRVAQERQVPGVPFPIATAYDVAQVLTWITSHQRYVEFQIEGTEAVPKLMRQLLKTL